MDRVQKCCGNAHLGLLESLIETRKGQYFPSRGELVLFQTYFKCVHCRAGFEVRIMGGEGTFWFALKFEDNLNYGNCRPVHAVSNKLDLALVGLGFPNRQIINRQ